ncbi:MAG: SRPBCC family protein [Trueperaceae bacterium]
MSSNEPAKQELVLERTFNAPRGLVFKVWTTPEHLAKWWGPQGFTTTVETLELKPGGNLLLTMHSADGFAIPTKGTFQEITQNEKLVFTTSSFEDEAGNAQLEVLNTVTLTEVNGKTKLTLHALVLKSTPAVAGSLAGMEMGWNSSLDRLGETINELR